MNANLMTKKIEMSKNEAKAAGKIGTPEFEELKNYMAMYPGFEIQIKAPAPPSPSTSRLLPRERLSSVD